MDIGHGFDIRTVTQGMPTKERQRIIRHWERIDAGKSPLTLVERVRDWVSGVFTRKQSIAEIQARLIMPECPDVELGREH